MELNFELHIGGITPFSTVDWPGKLSCVAFLAGCPWNCPYCQNHILKSSSAASTGAKELFSFLETRQGLLDAVVFSGGEPLAQTGVAAAAKKARELGFATGLHTCGAFPKRLEETLPYLDWVGLDIKAPWDAYERITGVPKSEVPVKESLALVLASNCMFEARTTWHPHLLSEEDIAAIGAELHAQGVGHWAVQAYRHQGTDGSLSNETVYPSFMPKAISELFEHFEFRSA